MEGKFCGFKMAQQKFLWKINPHTFTMAFYTLWSAQLYVSYCVSKATSLINPIPFPLTKMAFKNTGVQKSLRGIMFALPS